MSTPVVELSGKCTLQFKTSSKGATCKIEVRRKNREGENNADGLIGEVFHFAILRHGVDKFLEMAQERAAKYDSKYKTQGLQE